MIARLSALRRWQRRACRWRVAGERAGRVRRATARERSRCRAPSPARSSASIIFASLGWPGWALLLLTFVAASVSSRLGLRRKMLLGIAEERGGRRGAGNAIANTGVAAIAALLVAGRRRLADAARLAFVAALAAGGSDTIASEIGKAWGRRHVVDHLAERACRRGRRARCRSKARPPASSARSRSAAVGDAARPVAGVARSCSIVVGATVGSAGRERARRDARRTGHPEQRHAELHQHRPPRRVVVAIVADRRDARPPAARVQPAVHAGRAGARLRLGRGDRVRRGAARSRGTPDLLVYPLIGRCDGGGAQRRQQRAEPDLRPRDRSHQQAEAAAAVRTAVDARRVGVHPRRPTRVALVLAWLVAPGGRHECFWLVARRRRSSPCSTRCRRCGPSGSASGRTSRSRSRAACC